MQYNRFWELLGKKKIGEASPEEQTELNQYLNENVVNDELLEQIDFFWDTPIHSPLLMTDDYTKSRWNRLRKKITSIPLHNKRKLSGKLKMLLYGLSIAASITVIFFVFSSRLNENAAINSNEKNSNIVSTKNGSKSKIELPDGTQVWLNAGSKIIYNETYGVSTREIELTGEAYFEVVHNARKPFIIHTKVMNVKVLRTIFNVKAYPDDKTTEASLIKGSIEVSFPGRIMEKLILKPNEKITVLNNKINEKAIRNLNKEEVTLHPGNNDNHEISEIAVSHLTYQGNDNMVVETAWTKNKMIFRSKNFEDLARDMEHWFNVEIRFSDAAIRNEKFTGSFNSETITDALDELKVSYPFNYKYDKNEKLVIIYNK